MPVSLENRGAGPTSIRSPSAINTWISEEFRTIGAEVESRWLGASSGYLGDVALIAAVYGWNDPAGVLIADRGFALSDRPSTLFNGLGKPAASFYPHEIDGKAGYWRSSWAPRSSRGPCSALRQPRRPRCSRWRIFRLAHALLECWGAAGTLIPLDLCRAVFGWRHLPRRLALRLTLDLWFYAGFMPVICVGKPVGTGRTSPRAERLCTHRYSRILRAPNNQNGHGWTFAWSHEMGEQATAIAGGCDNQHLPRGRRSAFSSQEQSPLQFTLPFIQFGW